jgi:hypothetical protein
MLRTSAPAAEIVQLTRVHAPGSADVTSELAAFGGCALPGACGRDYTPMRGRHK